MVSVIITGSLAQRSGIFFMSNKIDRIWVSGDGIEKKISETPPLWNWGSQKIDFSGSTPIWIKPTPIDSSTPI
jgi:hypothetical protein